MLGEVAVKFRSDSPNRLIKVDGDCRAGQGGFGSEQNKVGVHLRVNADHFME